VDALVGYLSHADAELAPHLEGVPLVIVDRDAEPSIHGVVRVDTAAGVRDGLRHLIDRGHRRIAMIDCDSVCDPLVRRRTFLAVVDEYRLPVDEGWIVSTEQSIAGGAAAFGSLRAARPDLTAILAFNDLVAIGACQAAREHGVRIPADCALLGYDGLSMGELLDPPLTTVHIDKRKLGELTIRQVHHLLAGHPPQPAILRPNLLVRGST
jgi:LacI family transcriptional regulator